MSDQYIVGARVRLTRAIERFPYFTADAGLLGTIVTVEPDLFAVRLDKVISAAEDWDNELHWDGPEDAVDDIELVNTASTGAV